MVKKNWVPILRSAVFLVIAVVFFSVRFYDISLVFETAQAAESGDPYIVYVRSWDDFYTFFDYVFKGNYLNMLLGVLFLILGATEFIGVKK